MTEPEPTKAQIEAAAKELWNDRDARMGGPWESRDPREVCVIQTKATARAMLKAALVIPPIPASNNDLASFTPITGPGVDALENRKESDDGPSEEQVNADLRNYITYLHEERAIILRTFGHSLDLIENMVDDPTAWDRDDDQRTRGLVAKFRILIEKTLKRVT